MHENKFGKICVASRVSWFKPWSEEIAWVWLPSLAVRSFFHQGDYRTLKLQITNVERGFWIILSDICCSKFRINWSNKSLFWLGDWDREITYPFLFWILLSSPRHSFKFREFTGGAAQYSLKQMLAPPLFQLWGLSALIKVKSLKLSSGSSIAWKNSK